MPRGPNTRAEKRDDNKENKEHMKNENWDFYEKGDCFSITQPFLTSKQLGGVYSASQAT
jgi:hypothetical protein